MTSFTPSIDAMDELRRRAAPIRRPIRGGTYPGSAPRTAPPGYPDPPIVDDWSKSLIEPARLLGVFPALRAAPGAALTAYVDLGSLDPQGYVYGLPAGALVPHPWECMEWLSLRSLLPRRQALSDAYVRWVADHGPDDLRELLGIGRQAAPPPGQPWRLPRPPGAFADFLEAVAGDGSPWSFVAASLFAREAEDFACGRHKVAWSHHKILGGDPWADLKLAGRISRREDWKWYVQEPADFAPLLCHSAGAVRFDFFTYYDGGKESIYHHTDQFTPPSLCFSTSATLCAQGPGVVII